MKSEKFDSLPFYDEPSEDNSAEELLPYFLYDHNRKRFMTMNGNDDKRVYLKSYKTESEAARSNLHLSTGLCPHLVWMTKKKLPA